MLTLRLLPEVELARAADPKRCSSGSYPKTSFLGLGMYGNCIAGPLSTSGGSAGSPCGARV
jgi:hypothetical protein